MSEISKSTNTPPAYCYVKHYTHFRFFSQLISHALPEHAPVYFTDNLSLFAYIKYFKKSSVMLMPFRGFNKQNISYELSQNTQKTLRWESAYMQKQTNVVERKFSLLEEWFYENMAKDALSFCWGGNNTESHAFGQAAKKLNHKVRFGEITNYPQTVYLDSKGTNYFSNLVQRIDDEMEKQPISNPEIIDELKNLKLTQKQIPQSSLKRKTQLFITLYGIQQFIFATGKRFNIWNVINNKFKSMDSKYRELIRNGEFIEIEKCNPKEPSSEDIIKILVPLQVNHDTQLHVFSEFKSPFDYIRHLISIADSRTELHIKLHPAENNEINKLTTYLINKINDHHSNIKIVSDFYFDDYDCVATINSTFGIDALLANCKVITFGKSLYSDFNFVLEYEQRAFKNLRDALTQYGQNVDSASFSLFATTIMDDFYDFNYFGDNIAQDISKTDFKKSVSRIQKELLI